MAQRPRKSRAKLTSLQREQRKKTRSDAAKLKKAGVLPETVDARKVTPSRQTQRLRQKYAKLLEGKEQAYKVPPEKIKELKAAGYTVTKGGKVILAEGQFSRRGKIFTKKALGTSTTQIQTVKLGVKMDAQIRAIFATLKPGEFVGFQVYGHNSYDIYQDADAMISKINEYVQRGAKISNIGILRITNVAKWRADRAAETTELEAGRRKRRAARRKELRGMKKGLRVTRGR